MNKTRYEVRTKGDGEFNYFVAPSEENGEAIYNPQDRNEAYNYAVSVNGWVVEITERIIND